MKILSIDQSLTNCAIIIWEDGLVYDFQVIHSNKELEDHQRIFEISSQIAQLMKEENIQTLAIEGLSLGNNIGNSTRVLAGLYYSILIEAYKQDIEIKVFTPTQVKKFATSSGKAKKPEMFQALPDKIKNKIENSNYKTISKGKYDLADAYFIGKIYLENYTN